MKALNSLNHITCSLLPALALTTCLSFSGTNMVIANEIRTNHSIKAPKSDSVIVKKTQVSKKCKIKLYPNATNEVIFFSANGEEGKLYELFVFGMDGKLIKRIQVYNRETTLLKTFQKGSYMFEIFSNDERIENGSMIIN